ncbi:Potassium efflux system KefA protein / Small-conductance mechanosensitive channel [Enhygromyxa salina]|uniref:Potassium efflux system KefA protein / Small-conductance mechanosensitive channel n=1 Tax=Enhygromyxa salina TaxID=215803 RepID=A0A0C1ZI80_9BACT|nr:mechanosensitive ion channel family protein [Enhygromyxa salina]KIG17249.1 Potassium efflux system KefA protein / Small-conductance mechanosensitive channel [Enhygromyxa salina]
MTTTLTAAIAAWTSVWVKKPKGGWLAQLLAKDPDDIAVLGLRLLMFVVLGLLIARLLGSLVARFAIKRGSAQGAMLGRRFVFYSVIALTGVMILEELGVELSVLLGAAGILTVAVGFASQTSASNLISGLFLLGERPFSIGDAIRVGDTTGEVLSVDLLSVKLRTFDNLFVRVPNESLIKSEITNLTRNPIRRINIDLVLSYDEDVDRVRALLCALAGEDPDVLEEPEPVIWVDQLGSSALHVRYLVWASNRHDFHGVRARVQEKVAKLFRQHGIGIGYPRVQVGATAGAQSEAEAGAETQAAAAAEASAPAGPQPGPR